MLIRYFSDLHLEFYNKKGIQELLLTIPLGLDEVCICAGDMGNPFSQGYDIFFNFLQGNFKRVFVIAGNHEYYGSEIPLTNEFLVNYFKKFSNVRFLKNEFEIYEGFCFIGTTLWSQIDDPLNKINDMYKIPNFTVLEYNRLHKECLEFLGRALLQENCIVISHHLPSFLLINEKYLNSPSNQWFASNLDSFIEHNKERIKCWFYGHTHAGSIQQISGIPFLCNPIGYPGENLLRDFNKTWTVT